MSFFYLLLVHLYFTIKVSTRILFLKTEKNFKLGQASFPGPGLVDDHPRDWGLLMNHWCVLGCFWISVLNVNSHCSA